MSNYSEPKNQTEKTLAFMTKDEFEAFLDWAETLPCETLEECLAAWTLLKKQQVNLN